MLSPVVCYPTLTYHVDRSPAKALPLRELRLRCKGKTYCQGAVDAFFPGLDRAAVGPQGMDVSQPSKPQDLIKITQALRRALRPMQFQSPVTHVYNPLEYAWEPAKSYLEMYGQGPREILLLGMNPGPWGMAQTGVPFGEIAAVKDWLGISGKVKTPQGEHPKRPIEGFACARSEVSGRRLWGWAMERFGTPKAFFERFFVANYCPLVFMEESGKNRTPDKLPKDEQAALEEICDRALAKTLQALQPQYAVGVGAFAESCLKRVVKKAGLGESITVGRILHPSPASPLANRGWAPQAEKNLAALGIEF